MTTTSHPAGPSMTAGLAAQQAGSYAEAAKIFKAVIERMPEHAEAHNFLGLALWELGEGDAALVALERSLKLAPHHPMLWSNAAAIYQRRGLDGAAEGCMRRAIALNPNDIGPLLTLGNVLRGWDRKKEAVEFFEQALALDPDHPEAIYLAGDALVAARQYERALPLLRRAVELKPEDPTVLRAAANAERQVRNDEACMRLVERALALAPEAPENLQALGGAHGHFGRYEQAVEAYQRALAVEPDRGELYQNLAVAYGDAGRHEDAEDMLVSAIERLPDNKELRVQLSFNHLQHGFLAEGWTGMEHRKITPPYFDFPRWEGQPLEGKRVLLLGEQGIGDHIQFARFASKLAERGAVVDVLTAQPTADIFRTLPGINEVHASIPEQRYDYWNMLMSVPCWLGAGLDQVGSPMPYLSAEPGLMASWRERIDALAAPGTRRIGLIWAGNPEHPRDDARSMHIRDLAPLAGVEGVTWFSLQKGYAEAQLAEAPAGLHLHPLAQDFADFRDTAAAMKALDLVIVVDTSSSHLAGALGVPVWVVLCAIPDWRWLLERSDSPWYPSARLFRQQRVFQWEQVMQDVAEALR